VLSPALLALRSYLLIFTFERDRVFRNIQPTERPESIAYMSDRVKASRSALARPFIPRRRE